MRVPPPAPPSNVLPGMTYIYVWEEGPKKSALAALYWGPYCVLRQLRNTVKVLLEEGEQTISLA